MKKDGKISMIFYVLAAVCLLYFAIVAAYTGLTSKFHIIWAVFAVGFFIVGKIYGLHHRNIIAIPKPVLGACLAIIIIVAATLTIAECCIIGYAHKKPESGASYMIVLGSQVKGTRLSRSLKARVDTAYEYALENPDTIIIVSGGQGSGEDITEAKAMKDYLVSKGIPEANVIEEDKSVNTDQNIAFSRAFMDDEDAYTVVVTNSFHVYRSVGICKKQGMDHVAGLGAPNDAFMLPSYYLREGIAVIKYKLCGQI